VQVLLCDSHFQGNKKCLRADEHAEHASLWLAGYSISPVLDHIPLYSPLSGGVDVEGLVTCCLSLSLSHSLTHTHDHAERASLRLAGYVSDCLPYLSPTVSLNYMPSAPPSGWQVIRTRALCTAQFI